MTRVDAAEKICAAIDAAKDKYSARTWRGGDKIRVYFRHARNGDLGYVEIGLDGSLDWCVRGIVVRPIAERALAGVPIAAAETARGSSIEQLQRLGHAGEIARSGLSENEIADAATAGAISASDAMNRDF